MYREVNSSTPFHLGSQSFKSYFRNERRNIRVEPFAGRDFSSMTGIFPGQGIAFEGQFSEWLKGQSRLRDFFQTADAYAQTQSLPRPSLYLTAPQRINPSVKGKLRNLALFTLEVGLFEELSRLGLSFRRLASYSFGEYAGWTAAGVLSFAQMLEVVYWREELSPPPFEAGAMILVGASEEKIVSSLGGFTYYVANRNLPEQIIIACEKSAADRIVKELFKRRIPCQKIQELAQPYHSPLLMSTADQLAAKLSELKLEIGEPRVPLFSSVLNRWVDASNFERKEFVSTLSRQLVEPVNFINLKRELAAEGAQSVIELGPATSCSDLLKKLDHGEAFTCLPLTNYFRGETVQRKEYDEKIRQSKFVNVVSKVVARLTGYEIEDIVIEDRFQEDLGVDSLKKAEVMFEVLHEAKMNVDGDLNTSRFKALGDLVEYLEFGPQPGESQQKTEQLNAPFARYIPDWIATAPNLRLPIHPVFREFSLDITQNLSMLRTQVLEQVQAQDARPVLLRLDCPKEDVGFDLSTWLSFVRFWRDLFTELAEVKLHLALVGQIGRPVFAGVQAFFKSVAKEMPQLIFLPVACEDARPDSAWIWDQMQRPRLAERKFSPPGCQERGWTQQDDLPSATPSFKPTKMVWLGGSGGIAYELLCRYPSRGEVDLHLLGRRPVSDISVQDRLSMLELEFASVTYHQVDAGDREKLHQALDAIDKACGGLDFAVNATGVDRSAPLKLKVDSEIEDELRQKLAPAANLESWCHGRDQVYQIHFSSIVGLFGNANQSVYALANATLSGQVLSENKKALVVHWPAWQNVGMTARSAVRLTLMENGVSLLQAEEGADYFWRDVSRRCSGEVTYLTEPYLFQEQVRNVNFENIRDFMGAIPGPGRRIIEKRFQLNEDSYLLDHRIQGKCCVPAAAVIMMFLELVYLVNGEFKPIRDFEMMNMLIVDPEGMTASLGIRPITSGMQIQLRSLLPHARSALGRGDEPELKLRLPVEAKAAKEWIPMKHFYSTGVLFHGPRHQMIHETWKLDSETLRARIERSRLSVLYGNEFFDVLMPMFDAVFQLLIISSYLQSQMKALPVAVKFLRFNSEVKWTDNLWVQTETNGFHDGVVQGAGVIYNDNGEIIAELHGVTVREGTTAFAVTH